MSLFRTLLGLFLILASMFARAQSDGLTLSPEELKNLMNEAPVMIEDFQHYLKQIVNPQSKASQEIGIETCLSFFTPNAQMEVSNTSGQKRSYSMEFYLREKAAKYLDRYSIAVIGFDVASNTLTSFKDSLDSKGKTIYVAYFTMVQSFCANKNPVLSDVEVKPKWDYCDRTKKKGKIIVERHHGGSGSHWLMKLHDVKVEQTTKN